MTHWEYLTIYIRYDRKQHKDWLLEYSGKPPLVGLQSILDAHARDDWELVSLAPEQQQAYPGFGQWTLDVTIYRAVFKRAVGGADAA
jgi:hypothetical protein